MPGHPEQAHLAIYGSAHRRVIPLATAYDGPNHLGCDFRNNWAVAGERPRITALTALQLHYVTYMHAHIFPRRGSGGLGQAGRRSISPGAAGPWGLGYPPRMLSRLLALTITAAVALGVAGSASSGHKATQKTRTWDKTYTYVKGGKKRTCTLTRGAKCVGARLPGKVKHQGDLRRADLRRADLRRAYLFSADLRGAKLDRTNLARAMLIDANLTGARLPGAKLTFANLGDASLYGAQLGRATLRGASLERANLNVANLTRANLRGANLRYANLGAASLIGATLRLARLYGASLPGAGLKGADLRGADLRDAWLFDADLTRADLTGANLTGADLRGATWRNTTCPDGTVTNTGCPT